MSISPFFHDLRAAYQAEIDDLTFDSEGRDVLRQRLADKRKEIGFLVSMMELAPEMVAVVFHQAFSFRLPGAMDDLLRREADELPDWSSFVDALEIAPWARSLADVVLKEPGGEWFLTVAAGLEYMASRPQRGAQADASEDDADGNARDDDEFALDDDTEEGDGPGDAKARREAGDDWMVEQGFDRKD